MDRTEIARTNAAMTERVLGMPAAPVPDGGYALRVLRARGRRSGTPRDTPIGVVSHGGALHLVSPDDTRDWVRNLHADPHCTLLAADHESAHTAVEPEPGDAAAVTLAYLRALDVPWAARAFPVTADDSPGAVVAHVPPITVFRLDPA